MHALEREFGAQVAVDRWLEAEPNLAEDVLYERILEILAREYDKKADAVGTALMRTIEKEYMLKFLDMHWREHLAALDYLRQGIGLRSYAQKNPKQEYKREAFEMFSDMLDRVKRELIGFLSRVQIRGEEDIQAAQQRAPTENMQFQHPQAAALGAAAAPVGRAQPAVPGMRPLPPAPPPLAADPATPFTRDTPKIGRNDPCHCGSGKKFKHCHGKLG
jgi:preprotein translocase subunit SecA